MHATACGLISSKLCQPIDEGKLRLEELSKREGLTVEQMVRLGINDFIGRPDESFRAFSRQFFSQR
ncbi:hypothetical protein COMA2_10354 [Candidatus Nitrospira nitrificans]|uniref:Uncharacterized protein n=1 Tax=Candidatus Nitrospira nitrificans TaxID=1742973 RepID=A0A0S4L531_9BACT|nr:hypothetical protein COMA2_10354 [Candidatus Nitrospira nitrificans]